MTTFNFDMHRIGQTIARLRRERNMTQMQLADEMGVSFQAVSNWERGESMPDISKLPELATLFSTTIDALLGHHSPLIEKAAENKLDELPEVRVEELTAAAPILPPKQIDSLTDTLMGLTDLPDMTELLPFLSTAKVDELLRQHAADGKNLSDYAVFASTATVDEVALSWLQQEQSIAPLVPFMSQKAVDTLAKTRESNDQSISFLVPFLGTAALNAIVISRLKSRKSITALLPFVSQEILQQLFEAASTKD